MLQELITFVLVILIAGCAVMAVKWFLDQLNLPQPIKNIVLVILAIVGLVFLLQLLGIYTFAL